MIHFSESTYLRGESVMFVRGRVRFRAARSGRFLRRQLRWDHGLAAIRHHLGARVRCSDGGQLWIVLGRQLFLTLGDSLARTRSEMVAPYYGPRENGQAQKRQSVRRLVRADLR